MKSGRPLSSDDKALTIIGFVSKYRGSVVSHKNGYCGVVVGEHDGFIMCEVPYLGTVHWDRNLIQHTNAGPVPNIQHGNNTDWLKEPSAAATSHSSAWDQHARNTDRALRYLSGLVFQAETTKGRLEREEIVRDLMNSTRLVKKLDPPR